MIVLVDENTGMYTDAEKISNDEILITVKGIIDDQIYFQFRMTMLHYSFLSSIEVK